MSMPIYEFHCKDCRNEFKTLRRAEQLAAVTCPTCGTGRVARLLSVTAHTSSNGAAEAPACSGPGLGGACCGMNPMGCGRQN
jgi:putative FmdB family regulatory protein